jgi:hypothetical protein
MCFHIAEFILLRIFISVSLGVYWPQLFYDGIMSLGMSVLLASESFGMLCLVLYFLGSFVEEW